MGDAGERQAVRLAAWAPGDLAVLEQINTAEMKRHLGGPETSEQVADRHRRYLGLHTSAARMFTIRAAGSTVGTIGYWDREWQGEQVYESGWSVLPGYQRRGLGAAALREVLRRAASERQHRFLHAFPAVQNVSSNALCRRGGLELVGECDVEYPPGQLMHCCDWRATLLASGE